MGFLDVGVASIALMLDTPLIFSAVLTDLSLCRQAQAKKIIIIKKNKNKKKQEELESYALVLHLSGS